MANFLRALRFLRPAAFGAAALGALIGADSAALAASAGCTAINGGVIDIDTSGGLSASKSTSLLNLQFEAGEVITLTMALKPNSLLRRLELNSTPIINNQQINLVSPDQIPDGQQFSFTIPGNGVFAIEAVHGEPGQLAAGPFGVVVSVACQAVPLPSGTSLRSSANPSNVGDAVTFTATVAAAGGTPTGSVTFLDNGTAIGTVNLTGGSASLSTAALATGAHPITARYNPGAGFAASTSAVLNQVVAGGTDDSKKLREMQVMTTKIVAQTSGNAIQSAIDSAIDDGFSEDGDLVNAGEQSMHLNFAAEPKSARAKPGATPIDPLAFERRVVGKGTGAAASQAIDTSLGTSQTHGMAAGADSDAMGAQWRPWADIRYSDWDGDDDSADVDGNQTNLLAGVTYKINPRLLVGVFGGYEDFDFSSTPLNATMEGEGWTAGGYVGWRLAPALRLNAGLAHSWVDYSGEAGTASGDFEASRWFFTSSLVGTQQVGAFVLEPSAKVYVLWENDNAYLDSLGTFQPERDFSTGRASGGVKLSYPIKLDDGAKFTPFAGIYGDYYFSEDDEAANLTFSDVIEDGWSARFIGGFGFTMPSGVSASLSGEAGGVGSSGARQYSGRARLSVPF